MAESIEFVSRAGEKLQAALEAWHDRLPQLENCVVADLGANVGGFTHCLLHWGVPKVYSVDTGYGVLAWKLRQDDRVVVMERTNALHVELPEPVDMVVCDVAWTKQKFILPAAWNMLKPGGPVISLVKPQYESDPRQRRKGVVLADEVPSVLERVRGEVIDSGGDILDEIVSPLRGGRGNAEYLWLIQQNTGQAGTSAGI